MKRLIIVRHGNTFLPNETPTRIGKYTDLPLVDEVLPRCIGQYFSREGIFFNKVYAAPLKRTMETAKLILDEMDLSLNIYSMPDFVEIDYGVDENKTENLVIDRLGRQELAKKGLLAPTAEAIVAEGKKVIDKWNKHGKVPDGWYVDSSKIIAIWHHFANQIAEGDAVLVVSSNGIIRFSPHILNKKDYISLVARASLKVTTGSISIFDYEEDHWRCTLWNKKPQ